jgi:predicted nucleic acid-binding protein
VAALVDTNVLVYRYDPRIAPKQKIAEDLLLQGIAEGSMRVPHQAIVEFVSEPVKKSPPVARGSSGRPSQGAATQA